MFKATPDITVTQGDTGGLRITKQKNGVIIPIEADEQVILTVKVSEYSKDILLSINTYELMYDGTGMMRFSSLDTDLCIGSYVYSVEFRPPSGEIVTSKLMRFNVIGK